MEITINLRAIRMMLWLQVMIAVFLSLAACDKTKSRSKSIENKVEDKKVKNGVIDIVTNHMDFVTDDTISSGWHTFRYINKSNETHFFLIDQYPEGYTIEDTEKEVGPVFQKGMDLINAGNAEQGFEAFNALPEWFFEVVFVGGSGLVSPKTSGLVSLHLDPGYYLLECYVKMPNGKFHSSMGMVKPLIVTDEKSTLQPPVATSNITLSSKDGIKLPDTLTVGKQIFSVSFLDQIVHENFVGHDINLVKIDKNTDLKELEAWLNWADPKGMVSPAPQGFTFLGGVNDMPAGSTGYFEVELDPGNYVLISEVPNAITKNLFKPFVIIN